MTKISAEHLSRTACIYIRQSTGNQETHPAYGVERNNRAF